MAKLKYHYDYVGSFLRPAYVRDARRQFEAGALSAEELTKVEDKAVSELVAKLGETGYHDFTDGEFRRRYWHLDFLASLVGTEEIKAEKWSVDFKGAQPKAATVKIVDKLGFASDNPFLAHFDYLNNITPAGIDVKMTVPSPSMLHLICCVREENYQPIDIYKDEQALYDDMVATYQEVVKQFYAHGCRYLQLDDTSWGEFCDEDKRKAYAARGINVDEVGKHYVDVINRILEVKPADMTITMHICRGNFRSTWFSSGGYEPVAETLFGNCKVDAFFLEYDSDRAGDFSPLRFIKDQQVVLGLITSKFPTLEDKEEVKARIQEATQYMPLEQLALSPQCGFASCEEGNEMTEEQQWAKLALVKEIAEDVWGN